MEHSVSEPNANAAKRVNPSKKPRVKPKHRPTSKMVNSAIKRFEDHHHKPSLLDIKNYISANYKIDAEKLSPFIKKYIENAVTGGKLIQTIDESPAGSAKYERAQKKVPKAKKTASSAKKQGSATTPDKKTRVVAPTKTDFSNLIKDLEQRHGIEMELLRQLNLANKKNFDMQKQLRLMDLKNESLVAELARIKNNENVNAV